MRGEVAPAAVESLSLPTFDVTTYGAVADDGISDRSAFIAAAAAAKSAGGGIIYFP